MEPVIGYRFRKPKGPILTPHVQLDETGIQLGAVLSCEFCGKTCVRYDTHLLMVLHRYCVPKMLDVNRQLIEEEAKENEKNGNRSDNR